MAQVVNPITAYLWMRGAASLVCRGNHKNASRTAKKPSYHKLSFTFRPLAEKVFFFSFFFLSPFSPSWGGGRREGEGEGRGGRGGGRGGREVGLGGSSLRSQVAVVGA